MRRQYTSEERANLVAMVMSEGIRVPVAAAKIGVHEATAYNWVKQAKARPIPARAARPRARRKVARTGSPSFVRLVRAGQAAETAPSHLTAAIEVQVAGAILRVPAGVDAALLRAVVEALRGGAW